MKHILAILTIGFASVVCGATLTPIQLLNPAGSTAGQVITSTGPSGAPAWQTIGTTPTAGAFTTLSASSTVSGAGFVARFATPGPIGNTIPNTGAFTTLATTGAFTPSQTAGIVGTTTNNNANSGSLGEAPTNSASGIAMTNASGITITALTLGAGDWDVRGSVYFLPAGSTVINTCSAGLSTTSNTLPASPDFTQVNNQGTGTAVGLGVPILRFSLSGTTTINLIGLCGFTTSTLTGSGRITARRVR